MLIPVILDPHSSFLQLCLLKKSHSKCLFQEHLTLLLKRGNEATQMIVTINLVDLHGLCKSCF